ncbi:MAG: protein kinase [Candidatus Krumholzibacteria bacterium]|nr:protein kinase [Candidatus Krumholzibacteria bacterium]
MIGQIISHYRIVAKLGEGGMGVVYEAEDLKLKRTVALKFLRSGRFDNEQHKARFVREAQAAAALMHPNICAVYEIDQEEDQMFIVMPYLEGMDLANMIESGPLRPTRAVNIAIQIAQGLEVAHKNGIIHRDIKSGNIMVTPDDHAKITDFGLAQMPGAPRLTKSQKTVGTVAYMSPEQARGEPVDMRTDIWSLGVCLYEMLTGRAPFVGEYDTSVAYSILNEDPVPVSLVRGEVTSELERIVDKALAKNPAHRYQDAAEMISDMKSVLEPRSQEQRSSAMKSQPSIAVLPFADMSPEKDQEYFCDGIAEEIINNLVQVEGLGVLSRTSSFAFKGTLEDIRRIGNQLGVTTVLEGSIRKAGDRIRITAQLIGVADGYHIWSAQYDREMKDVFDIQEEIGQNIVQALKIELTEKEKRAMEKPVTKDIEAYDFYLRGRKLFYQTKRSNIGQARAMFSKAIRKDPDFARAHAGMADCYSYLFWYFDRNEKNLSKAMASSREALDLDPELAEAHAARGLALALNKQYQDAESEFETAIRLNASLFEAYYFYARTCFMQGKKREAAQWFEKACEVSPDDYQAPMMLGFVLKSLNLTKKGNAIYRSGLKNVERHLAANPDDSRALYLGSSALIELGEKEKALQWAMRAVALDPDDSYTLYGIVCNYSRLGEIDEAIFYLEKAILAGFAHKEWIDNDSDLDPLRPDPRFQALVKKLK